ncbi:Aste57867_16287 [Aphanomyces stellatus]|uniref:Aste57867_16287 protein n=1 Tax=Aphanomyces stellatus TaxID=120398 RepID=A0A485L6C3_9STRA|nr:hypothetical protein As57867_016230 [Aphanomyces stellatus]VFT93063.1 Aste57867_16287 [Aphanomyces stellatus]
MERAMQHAIARAQSSGALHKLTSTAQTCVHEGAPYLLLTLNRVEKPQGAVKPEADSTAAPKKNPFAEENLEADLIVQDVHGTHNLLLNKFNVVDEHLVLTTKSFDDQATPLLARDLHALWTCIQELDALGFFNCGHESGASQPHKHMQLITHRSTLSYLNTPLDELPWMHRARVFAESTPGVARGTIFSVPWFPFRHGFIWHDAASAVDPHAAGEQLHAAASSLLAALHPASYNLLLTRSLLLVVPRRARKTADGIEINSMGFAGSFLVREAAHAARFAAEGPFRILADVTFPLS